MNPLLVLAALTWCSGLIINESFVLASSTYYERINDHLIKEVQSEEPEANMAELRKWLNAKRTLMTKNSGIWPMIETFLELDDLFERYTRCSIDDVKILSSVTRALVKDLQRNEYDNFPLLRVDRLIQHYFLRYAMLCADSKFDFKIPHESDLGWKRSAYLSLNTYVTDHDDHPSTGTTFKLVKNHLRELEKEQMDGSVTDAARQFLALETRVLGSDKCTPKAYEILRANELAVADYYVLPRFPRQLQSAFKDLVEQYASLCLPIYQEQFQSKLRQLDAKTFRSVAILANEFFIRNIYCSNFRSLIADIDHKQYKQINPDMTTPQVVKMMSRLSNDANYEPYEEKSKLKDRLFNDELFPQKLKVFVSDTTPEELDATKLKSLFQQFVLDPCRKYNDLMEELLLPSLYNSYQSLQISFAPKDNLSLRLGQAAYQLCSKAVKIEDDFLDQMVEQALEIDDDRL